MLQGPKLGFSSSFSTRYDILRPHCQRLFSLVWFGLVLFESVPVPIVRPTSAAVEATRLPATRVGRGLTAGTAIVVGWG